MEWVSYHPRIESKELGSFLTTRSRNSELWFINNDELEDSVLGYAAKFTKRYGVKLWALAIEGNHIQAPALFPEGNRSLFMRDFNSCVARAVERFTPEYRGRGGFWGRRYSGEFLPGAQDVEEYFFYTVLQPVQDGLVPRISEYPWYNCFHDAVYGLEREYRVVRWGEYNAARRYKRVKVEDYTDICYLKYERLPGYEHMPQKEYAKMMLAKLEERRAAIVNERLSKGLGFVGREKLLRMRRGSLPRKTKTSTQTSHRPRVLSVCPQRRAECKAWYFDIYFRYKAASKRYRAGELLVEFPPGTYRPYSEYSPPAT